MNRRRSDCRECKKDKDWDVANGRGTVRDEFQKNRKEGRGPGLQKKM